MLDRIHVAFLLLGGEYHGQMVVTYEDRKVIDILPKCHRPVTPYTNPVPELYSPILYKTAVYNHSNRLQYMIATCETFESFDIESEIYKAQLPHLPEPCRRPTPDELHWQDMNGVGYFDRRNR